MICDDLARPVVIEGALALKLRSQGQLFPDRGQIPQHTTRNTKRCLGHKPALYSARKAWPWAPCGTQSRFELLRLTLQSGDPETGQSSSTP